MPLPTPSARKLVHTRRVEYRGYEREDGLWDIEGELIDTKPQGMHIPGERTWAPNEAIHHMHIRVTLDAHMVVRDIAAAMEAHPHDPCPQALPPMQGLIGESLGRGWRKTIDRHLGRAKGCTHMRELLFNLATAAFQSRTGAFEPPEDGQPPLHLGHCLAWDFDGPVVERLYPVFFQWKPPAKEASQSTKEA